MKRKFDRIVIRMALWGLVGECRNVFELDGRLRVLIRSNPRHAAKWRNVV